MTILTIYDADQFDRQTSNALLISLLATYPSLFSKEPFPYSFQ